MQFDIFGYRVSIEKPSLDPFSRSHLKRWAGEIEKHPVPRLGNSVKINRIRKAMSYFKDRYDWSADTEPRFGLKEAKEWVELVFSENGSGPINRNI